MKSMFKKNKKNFIDAYDIIPYIITAEIYLSCNYIGYDAIIIDEAQQKF